MSISEYQQKYSVGSFKLCSRKFLHRKQSGGSATIDVSGAQEHHLHKPNDMIKFRANIRLINEINCDDVDTHDANLLFTVSQGMKFRQNERTPS